MNSVAKDHERSEYGLQGTRDLHNAPSELSHVEQARLLVQRHGGGSR